MQVKKLLLLYHTGKYLRLKQIVYRLYYLFYSNHSVTLGAKNLETRIWNKTWSGPDIFSSTLSDSGEVSFLGESGNINNLDIWSDNNRKKLWMYNLHYLDELNRINSNEKDDALNELIDKWVKLNPIGKGIGWEPYPISLRIVNLVKWFTKHKKNIKLEHLNSLANQAEVLRSKLEYHILANHLLANAKALIFAGAFFNGSHADEWLKKGIELLDSQLEEQFLLDGGHFELSPMYHSIVLWDLCDLLNLSQCLEISVLTKRANQWKSLLIKGLDWLNAMIHPDKNISFFNDAAFDIAPTYTEIISYAQRLNISYVPQQINNPGINFLKSSGYCSVQIGNESKAIIDVAKVGPDYQPGHAHADTLSFELSLFGQRLFVNSGTSEYGEGLQRQFERSTAAHNTITIDDENSSEVWSGFRVARRAYPKDVSVAQENNAISIRGSHNGYRRLSGRNIHHREWTFMNNTMIIQDIISGSFNNAISRLYLHPDVTVLQEDDVVKCYLEDSSEVLIKFTGSRNIIIEDSMWSFNFGKKQKNKCLKVQLDRAELITEVSW